MKQFPEITAKMESAIRGYSFTMEEARDLSKRFLEILMQATETPRLNIIVDESLPPGTARLIGARGIEAEIRNIGTEP